MTVQDQQGVVVEPLQRGFRPVYYPRAEMERVFRMPNGDLALYDANSITQVVYAAGTWRCYYPADLERELR